MKNNINEISEFKNHFPPPYDKMNYGRPILDEHFFLKNDVNKISAHRMLYSVLISPQIDELVFKIASLFLFRGRKERRLIKADLTLISQKGINYWTIS